MNSEISAIQKIDVTEELENTLEIAQLYSK